ncbi:pirin family protein [Paenibacillus ginsengihumi]|jgi:redox-sensitive bicupin YhaK (pirin superfamily)|uniref:pirin family protein n=1 Tax=Paenibacillus ginsengihumi TaxID=431596 RepID=UPI0003606282|nr:pirin family protein [Paenibacillus ginsengihumi]
MIQHDPASSRYAFDRGWLRGHYSFSFADYEDENKMGFGPLRVFNDDWIAPGRGFGAHPHSDMEIVSIVLQGQLRHEDNLGNVAVTTFGEVQRMSAGSGIIHTEHNASQTEELNLLQMWFMPAVRGLVPSYEATRFDPERMRGRLLPVASSVPEAGVAKLHQDMTIYLTRLDGGAELEFRQEPGRRVFLFVIDGSLKVNESVQLQRRDAARIVSEPRLTLQGGGSAFAVLIDLP